MDIIQAPAPLTKKEAQKQVEATLESLSDLRTALGKKKFRRRMKKAGRLLTQGIPKVAAKKKQKVKEANAEEAA